MIGQTNLWYRVIKSSDNIPWWFNLNHSTLNLQAYFYIFEENNHFFVWYLMSVKWSIRLPYWCRQKRMNLSKNQNHCLRVVVNVHGILTCYILLKSSKEVISSFLQFWLGAGHFLHISDLTLFCMGYFWGVSNLFWNVGTKYKGSEILIEILIVTSI